MSFLDLALEMVHVNCERLRVVCCVLLLFVMEEFVQELLIPKDDDVCFEQIVVVFYLHRCGDRRATETFHVAFLTINLVPDGIHMMTFVAVSHTSPQENGNRQLQNRKMKTGNLENAKLFFFFE